MRKTDCILYIHGDDAGQIADILAERFGAYKMQYLREYSFRSFDMTLTPNEEADCNRMRTYPDGFLYYEFRAELEIPDDYIRITDRILELLWAHQMPAVASCDYEEELNRYIFSL